MRGELERLGEQRLRVDAAEAAGRERAAGDAEPERLLERSAPRPWRNPAVKLSPAPVASTACTDGALDTDGLVAAPRDRALGAELDDDRLDPLGQRGERRLRVVLAPAMRHASAAFGRNTSVASSAASSGAPALARVPAGVERGRWRPPACARSNSSASRRPEAVLQVRRGDMQVCGRGEQLVAHVGAGERGHRAGRGEDRAVVAPAEDDGEPGGLPVVDAAGVDVDAPALQRPQHELPGAVVADHADVGGAHPELAAPHATIAPEQPMVSTPPSTSCSTCPNSGSSRRDWTITSGLSSPATSRSKRPHRGQPPRRDMRLDRCALHPAGMQAASLSAAAAAPSAAASRGSMPASRPAAKPPISASPQPTALTTRSGRGAGRRTLAAGVGEHAALGPEADPHAAARSRATIAPVTGLVGVRPPRRGRGGSGIRSARRERVRGRAVEDRERAARRGGGDQAGVQIDRRPGREAAAHGDHGGGRGSRAPPPAASASCSVSGADGLVHLDQVAAAADQRVGPTAVPGDRDRHDLERLGGQQLKQQLAVAAARRGHDRRGGAELGGHAGRVDRLAAGRLEELRRVGDADGRSIDPRDAVDRRVGAHGDEASGHQTWSTSTPASRSGASRSAAASTSVISSSISASAQMLDSAERPIFEESQTTITRAARSTILRFVCASISSWVVSPGGVDAVDAQEHHVDVEALERALGERPDQLVGLRAGDPAGDDEPDRLADHQLGGDVDRVGDHGQLRSRSRRATSVSSCRR